MYAIAFDLDQEALKIHYPGNTPTNAYEAIRRGLEKFGFQRQQGSVYFGNESVTPVICVSYIDINRRIGVVEVAYGTTKLKADRRMSVDLIIQESASDRCHRT